RAACRVKQLSHCTWCGKQLVVVDKEYVHHQPDNLTRGEMVSSRFIGKLVETADEVFKDQPHVFIWHRVRVQVHLAELGNHEIKDICLSHPFYLIAELEVFKYAAYVCRKPVDVADEVLVNVVGVTLELFEGERGMVMKALIGSLVKYCIESFAKLTVLVLLI